jgi:hypothetical protein
VTTPGWLSGDRLRFALKPGEPLRTVGRRGGQDVERDPAMQLRVFRCVDVAHPAAAEGTHDAVTVKSTADHADVGDRIARC